jgi:hypothetical protein
LLVDDHGLLGNGIDVGGSDVPVLILTGRDLLADRVARLQLGPGLHGSGFGPR